MYTHHSAINMINAHLKILIVDDTDIVVERLYKMIIEIDTVDTVLKSNSYNEAVEIINNEVPDIILLDIYMPGKNGIDLLKFLKENYPAIKTIVVTNNVSSNYQLLCQSMGADHFIDKSAEFEIIPEIINRMAASE